MSSGSRGTFFADYNKEGDFKFVKIEHPLKDSTSNILSDSLNINQSSLDSTFNWAKTSIGYVAFSDSATVYKIDLLNNKLIPTGINMAKVQNSGLFNTGYNLSLIHI